MEEEKTITEKPKKLWDGALKMVPQRRVVWMWFGALPGAFGLGRAQPQRSEGELGVALESLQGKRNLIQACVYVRVGP